MAKAHNGISSIVTGNLLTKLELNAVCVGAWFKAFSWVGRVLIDLTIHVFGNIYSVYLAKSFIAVVAAQKYNGSAQQRSTDTSLMEYPITNSNFVNEPSLRWFP